MNSVSHSERVVELASGLLKKKGIRHGQLIGTKENFLGEEHVWLVVFELPTSSSDLDLGFDSVKVKVNALTATTSLLANL